LQDLTAEEFGSGEEPELLHSSFSPGIWLTPDKLAVVTAFYTLTNGGEDNSYTIRFGFF